MSLEDYRIELDYRDDHQAQGAYAYVDELQKLYFETSGCGPPVVLIPGLTGDVAEVTPLRSLLDGEFGVTAFDRRGYSRSPRGWSKSSMDHQAGDVARLIEALRRQPTFVIAVSLGASIALGVFRRHPGLVRGAILHEPWIPSQHPDRSALLRELDEGERAVMGRRAERNTGPFEARLRFLFGSGGYEALPAAARARITKNREMFTIEAAYSDPWLAPSRSELSAAGLARVVVTRGADSPPCTRAMAGAVAEALGARAIEVPGAHAAPLADPGAYHAAIAPWLRAWRDEPPEDPHAR